MSHEPGVTPRMKVCGHLIDFILDDCMEKYQWQVHMVFSMSLSIVEQKLQSEAGFQPCTLGFFVC